MQMHWILLHSGMELLAEVSEFGDEIFIIKKAVQLLPQSSNDGVQYGFIPFPFVDADDNEIHLRVSNVTAYKEASDNLRDQYVRATSSLDLDTKIKL